MLTFQMLLGSSLTFLVVFLGTRNMALGMVGAIVAFVVLWVSSLLKPCGCPRCSKDKVRKMVEVERLTMEKDIRKTGRRGERCAGRETLLVQKRGICPDCGDVLYDGPGGDGAQNAFCERCGSGFNDLGMFGVERTNDRRCAADELLSRLPCGPTS